MAASPASPAPASARSRSTCRAFRAKFLELYHGRYLRPLRDAWSPRSSNSCPLAGADAGPLQLRWPAAAPGRCS